MKIDLPQRDDPLARRRDPRVNDYVTRLMDRLHIGEGVLEAAGDGA